MPLVMKVPANNSGGDSDFEVAPEGTWLAICNMVADLGIQPTNFQGTPGQRHEICIRWELPTERTKADEPMAVYKTYTFSFHEKALLRKDLEGWRGRALTPGEDIDIFKLLGLGCQVSIVHSTPKPGKLPWPNVVGVVGWPKGTPRKAAEIGIMKYSPDEPENYPNLPQWIKNKIDKRLDKPTGEPPSVAPAADLDDEIPW